MEAMGAAFTTIAQVSAAGGQGGPSDLRGLPHIILLHLEGKGIRW